MAVMLNMTDSVEGFPSDLHYISPFCPVQSNYCARSIRMSSLARKLPCTVNNRWKSGIGLIVVLGIKLAGASAKLHCRMSKTAHVEDLAG
jgi:DUF1365 family protein